MKCNVVFHPATRTMSRCWNFCKTTADWTSPARLTGHAEKSDTELTKRVTLEKSDINTINWPSVDHEKKDTHAPLFCNVWPNTRRTTRLRWEVQKTSLSNIVHWDMFLLLQVWRQSCTRTQRMFYREGFWLMMGGSCRMAAVAFDLLASHYTVMRSNSVLTPQHLPFLHSYLSFTLPFACGKPPPLVLFVTVLGHPPQLNCSFPGREKAWHVSH